VWLATVAAAGPLIAAQRGICASSPPDGVRGAMHGPDGRTVLAAGGVGTCRGDREQLLGGRVNPDAHQVPCAARQGAALLRPAKVQGLMRQDPQYPGGVAARIGLGGQLQGAGVVLAGTRREFGHSVEQPGPVADPNMTATPASCNVSIIRSANSADLWAAAARSADAVTDDAVWRPVYRSGSSRIGAVAPIRRTPITSHQ
jgi:hypothetical protein